MNHFHCPRTTISFFLGSLIFLMSTLQLSAGPVNNRVLSTSTQLNQQALRVMCYNIRHGKGMDDNVDLERIADVIRKCQPDLVALQEVDHGANRTQKIKQVQVLAKLTGMYGKFGKATSIPGGDYGLAILSRWPITASRCMKLPRYMSSEEQRAALIVDIVAEKLGAIRIVSTHLQHTSGQSRDEQARWINEHLAKTSTTPIFLCGDFNAQPHESAIKLLDQNWQRCQSDEPLLTHPAVRPTKTIDYIFTRNLDIVGTPKVQVLDNSDASDHRPLFANFMVSIPAVDSK